MQTIKKDSAISSSWHAMTLISLITQKGVLFGAQQYWYTPINARTDWGVCYIYCSDPKYFRRTFKEGNSIFFYKVHLVKILVKIINCGELNIRITVPELNVKWTAVVLCEVENCVFSAETRTTRLCIAISICVYFMSQLPSWSMQFYVKLAYHIWSPLDKI